MSDHAKQAGSTGQAMRDDPANQEWQERQRCRQEAARELEDIKCEIEDLISQARRVLKEAGDEHELRYAESYWIAHLRTALSNDHSYLGGSMGPMQSTIDSLRGEEE